MIDTPITDEFRKGFEAAKLKAHEYVQRAREGEADDDLRSIAYRILEMEPDKDGDERLR